MSNESEDASRCSRTQQDVSSLLESDSDNKSVHSRLPSQPRGWTKLSSCSLVAALLTGLACVWGSGIQLSASKQPGHSGGQQNEQTATQDELRILLHSPSAGVGAHGVLISWLSNLDRCVGVLGGLKAAKRATHLKLVSCSDDALVFSVPTPDDPYLRLMAMPQLCVDNPGQTELQLWDCDDSSAHDNLRFFSRPSVEYSSAGTIQTFKNESRCMNCPRDEIGSPVQMWDCFPGMHHELFVFRVDHAGAAAARERKHLRQYAQGYQSANDSSHGDTMAAATAVNEDEDVSKRALAPEDTKPASSATPRAPGAFIVLSWASNLDLCAGVVGGLKAAKKSVHLKVVNCSEEDALVLSVPTPDAPFLRLMAMPQLCVDNPGQNELQLWECDDSSAHDNLRFILKPSDEDQSVGTIRTFKNRSRCMNCPQDEIGAPVQMWDCFPDFKHELFMLRVDHGGVAAASKSKELHHGDRLESSKALFHHGAPAEPRSLSTYDDLGGHSTVFGFTEQASSASSIARGAFLATSLESTARLCVGVQGGLRAAKKLVHLKLVSCSDDALAFSVPTPNELRLRLMDKPELCVHSPDLIQLQLWNCNDASFQQSIKFFPRGNGKDGSVRMIRTTNNGSMCMDPQCDRVGRPVQLRECIAELNHEFIMLPVEDGGVAPVST